MPVLKSGRPPPQIKLQHSASTSFKIGEYCLFRLLRLHCSVAHQPCQISLQRIHLRTAVPYTQHADRYDIQAAPRQAPIRTRIQVPPDRCSCPLGPSSAGLPGSRCSPPRGASWRIAAAPPNPCPLKPRQAPLTRRWSPRRRPALLDRPPSSRRPPRRQLRRHRKSSWRSSRCPLSAAAGSCIDGLAFEATPAFNVHGPAQEG